MAPLLLLAAMVLLAVLTPMLEPRRALLAGLGLACLAFIAISVRNSGLERREFLSWLRLLALATGVTVLGVLLFGEAEFWRVAKPGWSLVERLGGMVIALVFVGAVWVRVRNGAAPDDERDRLIAARATSLAMWSASLLLLAVAVALGNGTWAARLATMPVDWFGSLLVWMVGLGWLLEAAFRVAFYVGDRLHAARP
ncbi:hypothetical protein [Lysobacter fragariae]